MIDVQIYAFPITCTHTHTHTHTYYIYICIPKFKHVQTNIIYFEFIFLSHVSKTEEGCALFCYSANGVLF
jgi:hypothetical protein